MDISLRTKQLNSLFSYDKKTELEESHLEIIPFRFTQTRGASEIDEFQNALFKLPDFKTLDTMRRFCRYAQATSEATEFNLYSETDHLYIWIRLITRSRDYNVYVHYYDKAAVGGK